MFWLVALSLWASSILMQGYVVVGIVFAGCGLLFELYVVYSWHHDWVLFLGFRCAAYIRSLLYFLLLFLRVAGVSYTLSSMNIFVVYFGYWKFKKYILNYYLINMILGENLYFFVFYFYFLVVFRGIFSRKQIIKYSEIFNFFWLN